MSLIVLTNGIVSPLPALLEWLALPDTRAWLAKQIAEVLSHLEQRLTSDTSLRVPRKPEERANGFSTWLEAYLHASFDPWLRGEKARFIVHQRTELSALFASFAGTPPDSRYLRRIMELLWLDIEMAARQHAIEYLLRYAVQAIARRFVTGRLGDNWLLGVPARSTNGWSIPLFADNAQGAPSAIVVLDQDGNILSDDAALRRELGVILPGLSE